MAGDHGYVKPKTDGTFGLKTNWSRLTKANPSTGSLQPVVTAYVPKQPLTTQELETRTLREFWNWREWRKAHPLEQLSPSLAWRNYRVKYLQGKLPHGNFVAHLITGIISFGFVVNYAKSSAHQFAKHH